MSTNDLLRTPLHDWHVANGGRMVDFAGWSMPVQYKSIADEHHATRNAVGVFDISHMGRLEFDGSLSRLFVEGILTRRILDLKKGHIRYSLVCRPDGGILDDVLFYAALDDGYRPDMLVVNASNRAKILTWLTEHKPIEEVSISDRTSATAMIAIQGPMAIGLVQPLIAALDPTKPASAISDCRYYTYNVFDFGDYEVIASRTGYTGEDGVEIICDAEHATAIWETIIAAAEKVGGMAAGLGARDTLRLEAAMPLYGHELGEAINPIQAGLNFAVNLTDREFVGHDAIEKFAADDTQPVRIGIECEGKRVPRQGCAVLHNGEIVGEVTSGTYSPTLDRPIAMAYVHSGAHASGTKLTVDIRGAKHAATVVPLPFYSRKKK